MQNRRLSDKCVALQEESRADVKRSAHEMSQTRAAMQAEAERRVQVTSCVLVCHYGLGVAGLGVAGLGVSLRAWRGWVRRHSGIDGAAPLVCGTCVHRLLKPRPTSFDHS